MVRGGAGDHAEDRPHAFQRAARRRATDGPTFPERAAGNNLPVIIALLGIWYRNFFGAQSHLIAPYTSALRHLPAYLQQLEMESNGKSVDLDGQPVPYATAPVLWGAPGTNGQHAFFQML